jgi:hypothetical protein
MKASIRSGKSRGNMALQGSDSPVIRRQVVCSRQDPARTGAYPVLLCSALLGALLAAGCGASAPSKPQAAAEPTTPSVSLHLNVGSYTTSGSTASLSATVTPGASVTGTHTYPDNQGGKAALPLHFVRFHSGDWRIIVPLVLETFGSALRATNKGENVLTVKATKPGFRSTDQTITITRQETLAERAAEQKKQAQRLKEEEANPNSELNKTEREAEAKVKGAERQAEEEVKPYKEAEERSKNLKAKEAEEHLKEEESREQRRLESEGK